MKHIIASLSFALLTTVAIAQAPAKFNYQGIARNPSGAPIATQALGLRITIHNLTATGTTAYQETQSVITNAYGLYNIAIGTGTIVTGTLAGVNWSTGDKYMQVEIDPTGGTTYADAGTTQLLSVPYAMNSAKLSLPYSDTLTSTSPLLKLQNNGDGSGVEAVNMSTTASVTAVKGTINSTSPGGFSTAVRGVNNGTGGLGIGVWGSQAGSGWGVYGTTPTGIGVYGNASGAGYGVYGNSSSGTAVSGTSSTGNAANFSISNASSSADAVVVSNTGTGKGISVTTATGNGLKATLGSSPSTTVTTGSAVYGESTTGIGVVGVSNSQSGVYGYSAGPGVGGTVGISSSATGNAIWGVNTSTGRAGYFQGNVAITGSISKGSGTFKIDDPIDPENKYLYHSFVESPDMMNIYNGNVTTNAAGDAIITLPAYFNSLNKDVRYQLTVIGTFAQAIVSEEVSGNTFSIKTSKPNVKVSWQVTGVRKDPYANAHRVVEEVEKETVNKGKYLHPTEYGQPVEKGIDYDKIQSLTPTQKQ